MKNFTLISSRDNPVVKQIISLNSSAKSRKKEGLFVIEGLRICDDAYQNGVKIKVLAASETALLKYRESIELFSSKAEKTYILSDALIGKISDTASSQGVFMLGEMQKSKTFSHKGGKYIALENLQDPSNLGAVSRTAEALGIDGIVVTSNGCDPYSPKVLRASMGTVLRVPVYFTDDIIKFANENGLRTVACVVDKDAQSIKDFSFCENDILLIGNEGNGLTERTKSSADCRITIKMKGKAESLNAASAASIAIWEMCK